MKTKTVKKPDAMLLYWFKVEFKSCAPGGGWVDRSRYCSTPAIGMTAWKAGCDAAASYMAVSETGIRITFLGVGRSVNSIIVLSGAGFTVTLERV